MGTSTYAILAFGYDLGDSPPFVGLDEYDTPEWWDEEEDTDFGTSAMRRLLDVSGFTERYEGGRDGYHARERAAEKALGVKVVQHCSDSAPEWILSAKVITASSGYPEVIALPDLTEGMAGWLDRLAWATEALGITPKAERPEWLLASDWGA